MSKQLNVALIGNPNTGKTSVFNALDRPQSKGREITPVLRSIKSKESANYRAASKLIS